MVIEEMILMNDVIDSNSFVQHCFVVESLENASICCGMRRVAAGGSLEHSTVRLESLG